MGGAFQFPPLREGRLLFSSLIEWFQCPFQFPPLREGRPVVETVSVFRGQFQFPPLREGRLISFVNFVK